MPQLHWAWPSLDAVTCDITVTMIGSSLSPAVLVETQASRRSGDHPYPLLLDNLGSTYHMSPSCTGQAGEKTIGTKKTSQLIRLCLPMANAYLEGTWI